MTDQKLKTARCAASYAFALYDALLYLDAYPESESALNYFDKMRELSKRASAEYEEKYGPLTVMNADTADGWQWSETSWPWQLEEGE